MIVKNLKSFLIASALCVSAVSSVTAQTIPQIAPATAPEKAPEVKPAIPGSALKADAKAEKQISLHPASLGVVQYGLANLCASRQSTNILLGRAGMVKEEKLALNMIRRAMFACTKHYEEKRTEVLALVGAEALMEKGCGKNCTTEDMQKAAELIAAATPKMMMDYTEKLLPRLKATCSVHPGYDCVTEAVSSLSSYMMNGDVEWAKLNDQGRITSVSDPVSEEAKARLAQLRVEISDIEQAFQKAFPPPRMLPLDQNVMNSTIRNELPQYMNAEDLVFLGSINTTGEVRGMGSDWKLVVKMDKKACGIIVDEAVFAGAKALVVGTTRVEPDKPVSGQVVCGENDTVSVSWIY